MTRAGAGTGSDAGKTGAMDDVVTGDPVAEDAVAEEVETGEVATVGVLVAGDVVVAGGEPSSAMTSMASSSSLVGGHVNSPPARGRG